MLHFAIYLRHVKGGTIRIDEDADAEKFQRKLNLFIAGGNKAQDDIG